MGRALISLAAILFAIGFGHDAAAQSQNNIRSVTIPVPGDPFGVVSSADQKWLFVSVTARRPNPAGLAVFENQNGEIKFHHFVPMANTPLGMVITRDGKLLIVTAQDAKQDGLVIFFDMDRLISGEGNPRHLIAPNVAYISEGPRSGSIYANVTSDDKTLFVSDEFADTITVIDLQSIRTAGFSAASVLGKIPVGGSPIALTFSPDEHWLYTTSEVAPPGLQWPRVLKREGGGPGLVSEGALIVIDVAKAKVSPRNAIARYLPAGGSPVRLAISPDGSRLFVTARASNAVLVFDTAKAIADPDHARLAVVPVGKSPVPIAVLENGKIAVVGNSNRYGADANRPSTLTLLDTGKIERGINPVIASIPAGAFPREMSPSADGYSLFLTNYLSGTLQFVSLGPVQ